MVDVGTYADIGTKYKIMHDTLTYGQLEEGVPKGQGVQYLKEKIIGPACEAAVRTASELGDGSGSTISAALVTPQGRLAYAGIGDSPIAVFVVGPDGTVTQSSLLNRLHNPISESPNVLGHHASQPGSLGKLERDFREIDLRDISNPGDRVVVVAASDGVMEFPGSNGPPDPNYAQSQGAAYVQYKHGPVVTEVMSRGGNAEDIARELTEWAAGNAANAGIKHDNTSVVSMVLDPYKPPSRPTVIVAADGFGRNGASVSQAAGAAVWRNLIPMTGN